MQEDLTIRKAIQSRYADAAISTVEIERQANQVTVTIRTARPGIVIGRGGQRVEEIRRYLENLIGKKLKLNIQEVQQPELDANLVARSIAEQMERRIAYRRAMKGALLRTMQSGAKGARVHCAGRLGGAEIARRLNMHEGQVPLHTLRADIDYGFTEARTVMGRIGVKVWIYKGDILPQRKVVEEAVVAVAAPVAEPAAEAAVATTVELAPPMVEPVVEAVPVAQEEEKPTPVKRTRRKAAAAVAPVEETPAEPVAKKPARARTRKVAVVAEVEAPAAEAEKKPVRRTRKKAAPAEPATESGESDATT